MQLGTHGKFGASGRLVTWSTGSAVQRFGGKIGGNGQVFKAEYLSFQIFKIIMLVGFKITKWASFFHEFWIEYLYYSRGMESALVWKEWLQVYNYFNLNVIAVTNICIKINKIWCFVIVSIFSRAHYYYSLLWTKHLFMSGCWGEYCSVGQNQMLVWMS